MYQCDKEKIIKLWKSSTSGFGSMNFSRILQHCKTEHFPQFGLYMWEHWSNLQRYFTTDVSLANEVPFILYIFRIRKDPPWLKSVFPCAVVHRCAHADPPVYAYLAVVERRRSVASDHWLWRRQLLPAGEFRLYQIDWRLGLQCSGADVRSAAARTRQHTTYR